MSEKIFENPVYLRVRVEKDTKEFLLKRNMTEYVNQAIREKREREEVDNSEENYYCAEDDCLHNVNRQCDSKCDQRKK